MKIFLDSGNLQDIEKYRHLDGFTTNPSLMAAGKVKNYREFAARVLDLAAGKPVSFEVLSDEEERIAEEARRIALWGDNVYVKIPVVTSKGESLIPLIKVLSKEMLVNVTAVMSLKDIEALGKAGLSEPHIISVFAGRIADTGRDPRSYVQRARLDTIDININEVVGFPMVLWASARQVLDVKFAEESGADIITLTPALIDKMALFGKDLDEYSAETVKMFVDNAKGLTLDE